MNGVTNSLGRQYQINNYGFGRTHNENNLLLDSMDYCLLWMLMPVYTSVVYGCQTNVPEVLNRFTISAAKDFYTVKFGLAAIFY